MNALCITGPLSQDLEIISLLLQKAGMQLARPAKGEGDRTMAWLHAQLAAQATQPESLPSPPLLIPPLLAHDRPGRFWENQASDIFLGNLDSRIWGWCDPQSLALLEFWMDFDAKLNFILVCTRPEQLVARMLTGAGESHELAATLERWREWHQVMLRFHLRHPRRCLLVDAATCERDPEALVHLVTEHWQGMGLATSDLAELAKPPANALARHLAREMLAPFGEVVALQNELDATLPSAAGDDRSANQSASVEDLLADYRRMHTQITELAAAREDLERKNAELSQANSNLTQAKEQQAAKALQHARELQEENDLLLGQLHQVQEELEALFLKHEAAGKERDELRQAKSKLDGQVANLQQEQAKLIKARDEQSKLASDAKVLNAQLTKLRDELTHARDEQTKLLAEAKAQNAQLIREKAEQNKQLAERQAQISELVKTRSELTLARDAQAALAAERLTQVERLTKAQSALKQELATLRANPPQSKAQAEALESAQKRLTEVQARNELLLLQLHQVQDELGNYFNQYQELRQQLAEAEGRYQSLLESKPHHSEVAALEWVNGKDGTNTWLFQSVVGAGRSFKQVQLQTTLASGIAGLIFSRDGSGRGPLLRWPGADDQQQVMLSPAGGKSGAQNFAQMAFNFSTADWALLPTYINLLDSALEQGTVRKLPDDFDAGSLRSGLRALSKVLDVFPAVLRHDSLTLKREQVNPDYEHLWLQVTNLSLGKERWPAFEFRLSCAHLGPKPFGVFPKLEFPAETGQAPFDSWFEESHDDFGNKMELRFTLEHEGLDVVTWRKLSQHDQHIVKEILRMLPSWLSMLERGGVRLQRPWQDWQRMVSDMQRIMAHVAPPAASPGSAVRTAAPVQVLSDAPAVRPAAPKLPRKAKPTPGNSLKRKAR